MNQIKHDYDLAIQNGLVASLALLKGGPLDVQKIRESQGLSTADFAAKYGFEEAAVRAWEAKTELLEGGELLYLWLVSQHPDFVGESVARFKEKYANIVVWSDTTLAEHRDKISAPGPNDVG